MLGDGLGHTTLTGPGLLPDRLPDPCISQDGEHLSLGGARRSRSRHAADQLTGIDTSLLQHFGEFIQFALTLFLFGTFLFNGLGTLVIYQVKLFFRFLQLLKRQFTNGSAEAANVQQNLQKLRSLLPHRIILYVTGITRFENSMPIG